MIGFIKQMRNILIIIFIQLLLTNSQVKAQESLIDTCVVSNLSPKVTLKDSFFQKNLKATISKNEHKLEAEKVNQFLMELKTKTPYQILNITPSASPQEIKKSYRELITKWHPDVNNYLFRNEYDKISRLINSAYDILKDSKLRAEYDQQKNRTSKPNSTGQNSNQDFYTEYNDDAYWKQYEFDPDKMYGYDPKYVPPLSKILDDLDSEDLSVRSKAIRHLAKPVNPYTHNDEDQKERIIILKNQLANNPDSFVRINAAISLYMLVGKRVRSAIIPLFELINHRDPQTAETIRGYIKILLKNNDPEQREWAQEDLQIFYSSTSNTQSKKTIKAISQELGINLSEIPLLKPATSITELLQDAQWKRLTANLTNHNRNIILNNVEKLLYEGINMIVGNTILGETGSSRICLFVNNSGKIIAATTEVKKITIDGITDFRGLTSHDKYIWKNDGYKIILAGINVGPVMYKNEPLRLSTQVNNPAFSLEHSPSQIKTILSDSVALFQLIAKYANGQGNIIEQNKRTWDKVKLEIIKLPLVKKAYSFTDLNKIENSI